MYFANHQNCKKKIVKYEDKLSNQAIIFSNSRSTFEDRLKAKVCEVCGCKDAEQYEIHHIHKVKDLKGKKSWERNMIAKRRKIMVVCKECHKKFTRVNEKMISQILNGEPRYIERCKSGSERGLCKSIAETRQGDTFLLYFCLLLRQLHP